MSTKTVLKSNEVIDEATGEVVTVNWPLPPALTDDGAELVSPISLVSVLDRPLSIGERIRRFTSLPSLLEDDFDDGDDLPDDLLDHDEPMMSKHEDRAHSVVQRARARKQKEANDRAEADREARRNEAKDLQRRLDALRQEGATPPAPSPENAPSAP